MVISPNSWHTDETGLNFDSTHWAPEELNQILCEYRYEKSGVLVLTVEDTGIGILKENIEKLFMPFHQADASIRSSYGGSGLGLLISKSIAKHLGGDISLTSKLNKGSIFTLTMPCNVFINENQDLRSESFSDFRKIRVLLVDHKQVTVRTNIDLLQSINTEVVAANSSQEALKIFKEGTDGYFE